MESRVVVKNPSVAANTHGLDSEHSYSTDLDLMSNLNYCVQLTEDSKCEGSGRCPASQTHLPLPLTAIGS